MKWIHQFDLILLDFDGLLIGSEQLQLQAYQALCAEEGFTLNWDFHHFCAISHTSSTGLQEAIYAEFPLLYSREPRWEVLRARKNQIYTDLLKLGKLQLLPGVEQLLKELSLARIKRCVVTHSAKEQVELVKRQLPLLTTIPLWITREQYAEPKPAPDGYLKALQLLADRGDRIVGFEDSLRGVQALEQASIPSVLICCKTHPQLKSPLLKGVKHFASFTELPANRPLA
jgi:beta-phosphoglucomutase